MGTQADLGQIVDFAANGDIEPAIGAEFTLDCTADAFAGLEDRSAFGKRIIRPNL